MFLNAVDGYSNSQGISLDWLSYYTISSGGDVSAYVGASPVNLTFYNGTNDKTKFLDAVKSKRTLALENTSTDTYIIPAKIRGWNTSAGPQINVYTEAGPVYIYDSTDRATFLAYVEAVGK